MLERDIDSKKGREFQIVWRVCVRFVVFWRVWEGFEVFGRVWERQKSYGEIVACLPVCCCLFAGFA